MTLARRFDGLVWRFLVTIVLALLAALALNHALVWAAGVWAKPSITESGLPHRAAATLRIIEATPVAMRAQLADAASDTDVYVSWYPESPPVPRRPLEHDPYPEMAAIIRAALGDPGRSLMFARGEASAALVRAARLDWPDIRDAHFMGVALRDGGWLVFGVPERSWGIAHWKRRILQLSLTSILLLAAAFCAAMTLARPIEALAAGVRRFGTDPRAPPLDPTGPRELRATITAFNDMQTQISRFVADRTLMLAAISHDLRAPLTRIRLRAEVAGSPEHRTKIVRDVEEMQHMIDAALAVFRRGTVHGAATRFDLSELLLSLVDAYQDRGIELSYAGPRNIVYRGHPFELRRAFTNLIENALRHATPPTIELTCTADEVVVGICDRGPGIATAMLDEVFEPFVRGEPTHAGGGVGVGLGLTSARSVVRGHDGDIVLRNRPDGGCCAEVRLPMSVLRREDRSPDGALPLPLAGRG